MRLPHFTKPDYSQFNDEELDDLQLDVLRTITRWGESKTLEWINIDGNCKDELFKIHEEMKKRNLKTYNDEGEYWISKRLR